METPVAEKKLRVAPFAIHATRGILRDQRSRRKTMAVTTVVALILLVAGGTILRPWLDPHEHPWRFIFYWLACVWETILVLLLALLDLLLLRAKNRAERNDLREGVASPNGPRS